MLNKFMLKLQFRKTIKYLATQQAQFAISIKNEYGTELSIEQIFVLTAYMGTYMNIALGLISINDLHEAVFLAKQGKCQLSNDYIIHSKNPKNEKELLSNFIMQIICLEYDAEKENGPQEILKAITNCKNLIQNTVISNYDNFSIVPIQNRLDNDLIKEIFDKKYRYGFKNETHSKQFAELPNGGWVCPKCGRENGNFDICFNCWTDRRDYNK